MILSLKQSSMSASRSVIEARFHRNLRLELELGLLMTILERLKVWLNMNPLLDKI